MNQLSQLQERKLTLADVCEALQAGKLQANVENGSYYIRRSDLLSLIRRGEVSNATHAQRPTELAS